MKEPVVDETILEIEEKFKDRTLGQRLKALFTGLKAPRDSREYKEAVVELQRLISPVLAILIPAIGIAVLIVCADPSRSRREQINVTLAQVEDDQTLEDTPEDVEQPPDQDLLETDFVSDSIDTAVTVSNPAEAVPATQQTPSVTSVETVMNVTAPVMMKSVFAEARSAAGRKASLLRYGGSAETEAAVMRGLRWLAKQQLPNGSWPGSGGASGMSATGFVVLAFLAHGEKPGASPEFGEVLRKAMEYLMAKKNHDAMETCALAEAYGMTRNPNIKDFVAGDLSKLAEKLAEHTEWGYHRDGAPDVYPPNLLTMTFQVMSLRSSQLSRIKVPKIERALAKLREGYLLQGNKNEGGFSSDHLGPPGRNYRRTGTWHFMMGVVGMQYLGSGDHPIIEKTLKILDDDWAPPTLGFSDIACCPVRGNYWATMVFFNHGGPRWKKWNALMSHTYVKGQHIVKNQYVDHKEKPHDIGYWTCEDMHNGDNDFRRRPTLRHLPIMTTCYICQQLMVYYRYLPTGTKEAWDVKPEAEVTAASSDDVAVGIDDL